MGAERVRELLLDSAPRPKVAAGVLAYVLLQVLAQLGVDVPTFLDLPRETIEALIVFGVMWLVRDRFAVPMSEAFAAKTRVQGARVELDTRMSEPIDLFPKPRFVDHVHEPPHPTTPGAS